MIAGDAPKVIGHFEIDCPEFMFYQYLPIRMPESGLQIPKNLRCFEPLIEAIALFDGWLPDDYVYLTAKKMFVSPGCSVNRPGWHLDGFGTPDINYIWCDSIPTEFCFQPFNLSDEHELSLIEMEKQAHPENIRTYPIGTLLRLDRRVVHRVGTCKEPCYRTFAKISISKNRYNLKGNAHNYLFDYDWPMFDRINGRNHPIVEET
jgi:hypothetical protein